MTIAMTADPKERLELLKAILYIYYRYGQTEVILANFAACVRKIQRIPAFYEFENILSVQLGLDLEVLAGQGYAKCTNLTPLGCISFSENHASSGKTAVRKLKEEDVKSVKETIEYLNPSLRGKWQGLN
jgi:hypothetical protein